MQMTKINDRVELIRAIYTDISCDTLLHEGSMGTVFVPDYDGFVIIKFDALISCVRVIASLVQLCSEADDD